MHSLLRLPVRGKKSDLTPGTLQALQTLFQFCRFLIIDEKSIINTKTLTVIDERLRAIFSVKSDLPFSGLNVLLYGDFYQLPPVGGRPLFSRVHEQPESLKGHYLYLGFNRTIRLTEVMRQQGEDERSVKFRQALSELRVSELSKESWELFCTRIANQLPPPEVVAFETALRLYFINEEVRDENSGKMIAI